MAFKVRSAKYGVSKKDGEHLDVTAKVKSLSTRDGLSITVTNANLGVETPFPGQRKRLWVDYAHDGVEKSGDALERKSIKLPA